MLKTYFFVFIVATTFLSLKVPEVYLFCPQNAYSGSNCRNHLVMETIDLNLSKEANVKLFGFQFENADSTELYANGKKISASDTLEICKSLQLEVRFRQAEKSDGTLKFHSDIVGQKTEKITFNRDKVYTSTLESNRIIFINSSYNCTKNFKLNFGHFASSCAFGRRYVYIYKSGKLMKCLDFSEEATCEFTFPENADGMYKIVQSGGWFDSKFAIIFK